MEYNKKISAIVPGNEIEGFYILRTASVRTASNGKPYLNAVLGDISGTADAKMWDFNGQIGASDEGKVVKIRGEAGEFKGSLQINIKRIRLANEDDSYSKEDLVPVAPLDRDETLEYVKKIIASMTDADYREICSVMLKRHLESFKTIPAAKNIHHSFVSGLLMHTSSMLRIADFLGTQMYPGVINRSLLLAGTLLHDFEKDREFAFSELGLVTDLTDEGRLIGHLVLGAEEVGKVGEELGVDKEKIMLLKHMLLSHHGQPDFGAAVIPCTAEAELLSYIDLIDSRMEIYAENFETLEPGSFSDRIFALEKRIFNHGIQESDIRTTKC